MHYGTGRVHTSGEGERITLFLCLSFPWFISVSLSISLSLSLSISLSLSLRVRLRGRDSVRENMIYNGQTFLHSAISRKQSCVGVCVRVIVCMCMRGQTCHLFSSTHWVLLSTTYVLYVRLPPLHKCANQLSYNDNHLSPPPHSSLHLQTRGETVRFSQTFKINTHRTMALQRRFAMNESVTCAAASHIPTDVRKVVEIYQSTQW